MFPRWFGLVLSLSLACGSRTGTELEASGDEDGIEAVGGNAAAGGRSSWAGSVPIGATTGSGGRLFRGGATAAGGIRATGGRMARAGAPAVGGTRAVGGRMARAGAPAVGGITGTGGVIIARGGTAAIGGRQAVGGRAVVDAGPPCGPEGHDILLLSEDDWLYSMVVSTLQVSAIGIVDCGVSLYSMAVSRAGEAYVSSYGGELFRVDPATARCEKTAFDASRAGGPYTLGFGASGAGGAEVLRFMLQSGTGRNGVIDLSDYTLEVITVLTPVWLYGEILGDAQGGVYVYGESSDVAGLFGVDLATGKYWQLSTLPPGVASLGSYDATFYGDVLYLFNSAQAMSGSDVYRYDAATGTMSTVGSLPVEVIGAGTVPCSVLR